MTVTKADAEAGRRTGKPLPALCLAVLSYSLIQTMLVPTSSVLQRELGTTAGLTAWAVLSAPLLTSAVLTPLIGKLGDYHGKRRVLIVVLSVHLVATVGGMLAWDIWSLIGFRAVQGVSLGILPLVFGLIREALPAERAGHGLALASGLIGGSAGLGLVGGGLLVDHASWRLLFAVGVVIVAAALVLVVRSVPESEHRPGGSIDVPGAVLLGLSLAALLLALTQAPVLGWGSPWVLGLFLLAVVAFVVFLQVERRTAAPLIDPEVLVHRPILLTHLAATALGAAQFVLYVLVPRFAVTPFGLSPEVADRTHYGFGVGITAVGLIMLPGTLMTLVASSAATRLDRTLGARGTLAIGLLFTAAGSGLLAFSRAHIWEFVVFYGVASIGFGLVMAVLPRLVHDAVPIERGATANGVNTVARTAGGAVGSQLGAAVLAGSTLAGTAVPTDGAYGIAFGTAAAIAVVGAVLALGVNR